MSEAFAPAPDQAQRNAIVDDLDATMLVEAAAGTGKTTSLVARMTALVAAGDEGGGRFGHGLRSRHGARSDQQHGGAAGGGRAEARRRRGIGHPDRFAGGGREFARSPVPGSS